MATFLIAFFIIGVAVAGMAIGVIAGRPAIKGSCGGLNQIGLNNGDCACSDLKKKNCPKRTTKQD
ncbi:MAG: (Na+)-NQR maturation NqrM [Gammaproteobacteria bacterium]